MLYHYLLLYDTGVYLTNQQQKSKNFWIINVGLWIPLLSLRIQLESLLKKVQLF